MEDLYTWDITDQGRLLTQQNWKGFRIHRGISNDISENINIQILMYRYLGHINVNPDLPLDY